MSSGARVRCAEAGASSEDLARAAHQSHRAPPGTGRLQGPAFRLASRGCVLERAAPTRHRRMNVFFQWSYTFICLSHTSHSYATIHTPGTVASKTPPSIRIFHSEESAAGGGGRDAAAWRSTQIWAAAAWRGSRARRGLIAAAAAGGRSIEGGKGGRYERARACRARTDGRVDRMGPGGRSPC